MIGKAIIIFSSILLKVWDSYDFLVFLTGFFDAFFTDCFFAGFFVFADEDFLASFFFGVFFLANFFLIAFLTMVASSDTKSTTFPVPLAICAPIVPINSPA